MDEFLIFVAYLLQHTYNQSIKHTHTHLQTSRYTYTYEKVFFCLKMNRHQKVPEHLYKLMSLWHLGNFKMSVIKSVPQNGIIGGW